jgi:membrane-bound lytic murein transglycosylase D
MIHPGQKLIIYKKGGPAPETKATDNKTSTSTTSTTTTTATTKPKYHTVVQGESLWSISQKYDNVSFYDLLKVNGLTDKSKIQAGQKLKLP